MNRWVGVAVYSLSLTASWQLNTVDTNGETDEELLKNGANHAIQQHGMNANDIYLDNIPTNLICHSFNKIIKK